MWFSIFLFSLTVFFSPGGFQGSNPASPSDPVEGPTYSMECCMGPPPVGGGGS